MVNMWNLQGPTRSIISTPSSESLWTPRRHRLGSSACSQLPKRRQRPSTSLRTRSWRFLVFFCPPTLNGFRRCLNLFLTALNDLNYGFIYISGSYRSSSPLDLYLLLYLEIGSLPPPPPLPILLNTAIAGV